MNPAASPSLSIRKQIGPAVWLLFLLLAHTPGEWTGEEQVWVAGGNVVSDSELTQKLTISRSVLDRWRRRLARLGMLGWLISPQGGRVYWVARANRLFGEFERSEPIAVEPTLPRCRNALAIWRVIQERSIALTGKVVEDLDASESVRLAAALGAGSENPDKVVD